MECRIRNVEGRSQERKKKQNKKTKYIFNNTYKLLPNMRMYKKKS